LNLFILKIYLLFNEVKSKKSLSNLNLDINKTNFIYSENKNKNDEGQRLSSRNKKKRCNKKLNKRS
jgi:hypothetical protein